MPKRITAAEAAASLTDEDRAQELEALATRVEELRTTVGRSLKQLFHVEVALRRRRRPERAEHVLDQCRHVEKSDLPCDKGIQRHLVRRIEGAGHQPADLHRLARQPQRRETHGIGRLEIQPRGSHQVQRCHRGVQACWPAQAIGYGGAHIRVAQLGQHTAIHVLHEGMNHTLGVNDHLDLIGARIEQPARLDHLQPLVEKGRRVDGDFRSHVPGRVVQHLLQGDLLQLLARRRAENRLEDGETYIASLSSATIGYKGMIDLARRSGQIKKIYAHCVFEQDEFLVDGPLEGTTMDDFSGVIFAGGEGETAGVTVAQPPVTLNLEPSP